MAEAAWLTTTTAATATWGTLSGWLDGWSTESRNNKKSFARISRADREGEPESEGVRKALRGTHTFADILAGAVDR